MTVENVFGEEVFGNFKLDLEDWCWILKWEQIMEREHDLEAGAVLRVQTIYGNMSRNRSNTKILNLSRMTLRFLLI